MSTAKIIEAIKTVHVALSDDIRKALLELPRGVLAAHERMLRAAGAIRTWPVSVGTTATEIISAERGLDGREQIMVLVTHASQTLYIGQTEEHAASSTLAIPLGAGELRADLVLPYPHGPSVWCRGSAAATTAIILEFRRGGR